MGAQLSLFETQTKKDKEKVLNVASVPQRSPFRYPGGKTWLIPVVRQWLKQQKNVPHLYEPFAGGGIVSLTAAFENLAKEITMIELDEDIAAVWEVIINAESEWLANTIFEFDLTKENANEILSKRNKTIEEKALSTIIKNRIFHGGIITKGSGLIKNGEKGKGIKSRWYPKTLRDRIIAINHVKHKINFITGDAFEYLKKNEGEKDKYYFIDPPYTKAGKRLYTYFDIDHEKLFEITSKLQGKYMLTYDNTEEIRHLADKYQLPYKTIPMKTTHHIQKEELIISDNFEWWV